MDIKFSLFLVISFLRRVQAVDCLFTVKYISAGYDIHGLGVFSAIVVSPGTLLSVSLRL